MSEFSFGTPRLQQKVKLAYGVGHVFNDLCASMWFTYLLVYLQYVLRLDRGLAGFLLLLGQVADAISTPLVGIQSDKGCATSCGYGRRKTWHAIGTICVLVSFPFIFIMCRSCNFYWPVLYVVLIGIMIVVFQIGWASAQVSHMAMIPDLTPNEAERDELNIIRYFFDVTSDVLVYIIAWATFRANGFGGNINRIDPGDYISFEVTTIFIIVLGTFFSLIFHVFTPEAPYKPRSSEMLPNSSGEDEESSAIQPITLPSSAAEPEDLSLRISMTWRDWMIEPQFYYISLIYTSSRLVANMANIFMPIFLQESVNANQELITLIPLVMSLSGVASSLLLKVFRRCASKRASMVIAIVIGFFSCSVASLRPLTTYAIYLIAISFGISSSILIILSLAFTADLIGYCTDSSAFVYGSMSFWDKLTNGFVVIIIQELTKFGCVGDNCENYYKRVVSVGIAIPLFFCLIGVIIISSIKLGTTKKMRSKLTGSDETIATANESSPISSDSSEFLIATDTKMGYGAIARL